MSNRKTVLIGSPVHQDPEILKVFLQSIAELEKDQLSVDYFFIDDNTDTASTKVLKNFKEEMKAYESKVIIKSGNRRDTYECNENTHMWKEHLIWKVADYKNNIIDYSKKKKYDFLFLIDSDIVLHPKTLKHLMSCNKDIISEVFWTKWKPDAMPLPQVWLYDQYTLFQQARGERITLEEKDKRQKAFLEQLKVPGIYQVGGLGACTLIGADAVKKGLNYKEMYNLSFWGEDRHFCIRAAALGLELFADTTFPAYHIYRKSDLDGVADYKNQCKSSVDIQDHIYIKSQTKEIQNRLQSFVKSFFSCDYRIYTGYEGLEHLTPQMIYKMKLRKDKNRQFLLENQVKCCSSLRAIKTIKINLQQKRAEVGISIDSKVEKSNEIYHKIGKVRMVLKKNEWNWQVDFIELMNENEESLLGQTVVDIIQERKRICKDKENTLTLCMLVRNEADRFLEPVLTHAASYIDKAVILDDASTDHTVDLCKRILKDVPLIIASNKKSNFHNEIELRKQLWQMAADDHSDWILSLDADEIFEQSIISVIRDLINQSTFDHYEFRLFDMWNKDQYREDDYWQAHKFYRTFLLRYQPNFEYEWQEIPQHCGRFPKNIYQLPGCQCSVRLKHYGWCTEELRKSKYERYMQMDPGGKYGDLNQYRSILDSKPNLITF